jgi:hypothetical protein
MSSLAGIMNGVTALSQGAYRVCSQGKGLLAFEAASSIFFAATFYNSDENHLRNLSIGFAAYIAGAFAVKGLTGQMSFQNLSGVLAQRDAIQSVLAQSAMKTCDCYMLFAMLSGVLVCKDRKAYAAGQVTFGLGWFALRGLTILA